MINRITKSAVFFTIIFLNVKISSAQQKNKINEYSKIVKEVIVGNNTNMAKMSDIADDINCHLTKKQAETCGLSNFSEMRNRTCGSPDFPTKEEYTADDILKYKDYFNKLKKYYSQKH